MVFLAIVLLGWDSYASRYGRGVLADYYPLKFDTYLIDFQGAAVTIRSGGVNYIYIASGEWFVTEKLDSIHVKEVLGYSLGEELQIAINSTAGVRIMSFEDEAEVYNNSPLVKPSEDVPDDFVSLQTNFFAIKYWLLIFMLLLITIVFLIGALCIHIFPIFPK